MTADKFNYIKADQIAAKDRAEEFTKVSDGNDGLTKVTYTLVDNGNSETRKACGTSRCA